MRWYHFCLLMGPPLISKRMWSSLMTTLLMRARSPGFAAGPQSAIKLLQLRAAGGDVSILQFQPSLPHRKIGVDEDQLCGEGVDNLLTGFLGNPWRRSILGKRQRREDQKDHQEPKTIGTTVEGPHAAPRGRLALL